ncbi:hypothetical protein [Marinobacter nauticus]|uniref:DUF7673 domain-containing protein n=1 Tax=Marinobacter nauticus (strain ATCC 700491 / DSM 11845 / VT8) TaxID=351348 RepID=A1U8N3_MARN8|nr:hypothetical protein [Marinobacter nauticus]ABM21352.1 hypothetical protein Maqu_4080 [Marinobacter nauticus VT8]
MSNHEDDRKAMQERMAARVAAQKMFAETELPVIRQRGKVALFRLLPVAMSDTGQSSVVTRFLLGLYNGRRFPFDMTELRRLDRALILDCLAVLEMDWLPEMEVHRYFENGSALFEQMADRFRQE